METQCGQELQRALKQSSIKGIPKFLTVRSKYLKVLWMIATITFLSTGFYQSYGLLEEYLRYPTLTLLEEHDFDSEKGFVFPNILVCNVNQLGLFRNLPMEQNIEVYEEVVKNYTDCTNCTPEEAEWWESIRGRLISPFAYLQYVGLDNAMKIMSKYQHFLIECLVFEDINVIGKHCDNSAVKIKVVPSYEYFSCLIVSFPAEEYVSKVSMTFYIDSFKMESEYMSTNFLAYKSTGVAYNVFSPKNSVSPSTPSSKAPPGAMTTVSIREEFYNRLGQPHGNCIHRRQHGGGTGDCFGNCLNRAVWKECDCNPAMNVAYKGDKEACLSVRIPKDKLIKYQDCANRTIGAMTYQCSDTCWLGCSETRYHTQPSYSRWPIPYQSESFFRNLVESKPYSKMFDILSEPFSNDRDELRILLKSWLKRQLIEENFVKIDFVLDFTSYVEFTEVPKYSLFSFLGTLGGVLNLWTGITVVVFIEIIETMINILTAERDKNLVVEVKTNQ